MPHICISELWAKFSDIWIKMQNFSFTKRHLKTSSAKWRPFCPGRGDLIQFSHKSFIQYMRLHIFIYPISPVMIVRICVLDVITIINRTYESLSLLRVQLWNNGLAMYLFNISPYCERVKSHMSRVSHQQMRSTGEITFIVGISPGNENIQIDLKTAGDNLFRENRYATISIKYR